MPTKCEHGTGSHMACDKCLEALNKRATEAAKGHAVKSNSSGLLCAVGAVKPLTPFWFEDAMWIRVPGYKHYCTCIATGEQKILPAGKQCNLDVGT